jgi:hypothetical protein
VRIGLPIVCHCSRCVPTRDPRNHDTPAKLFSTVPVFGVGARIGVGVGVSQDVRVRISDELPTRHGGYYYVICSRRKGSSKGRKEGMERSGVEWSALDGRLDGMFWLFFAVFEHTLPDPPSLHMSIPYH